MGWGGYDLYDGDGTFTFQLLLLEKAGVPKKHIYYGDQLDTCPTCHRELELNEDKTYDGQDPIKLTDEHKKVVKRAYPKLVKYLKPKSPKNGGTYSYYMEEWSINWQMFADLIINNKLPMTKQIKTAATKANNWLISDAHCEDFNEPRERRNCVKAFGQRLNSYGKKK